MAWSAEDDDSIKEELQVHEWEVKHRLGSGSTGAVLLAQRPSESQSGQVEQAAIKAYRMSPDTAKDSPGDKRFMYNEVLRQLKLFHPHIIQFKSLIPTKSYICLVMEYANAGDLFKFAKHTKGLPEAAARFIFQQLVLVLDYCHHPDINVFIRDVKPSNLLLVWNSCGMPLVKLTDFNLAKDINIDGEARTPIGCTMWMSPQAVRNRDKEYSAMIPYGPICDIWSAGVTLYYLLYTKWPFTDKAILSWTQESSQVQHGSVKYPDSNEHGYVSEEVRSLLKSIFASGDCKTPEEYRTHGGITLDDIKRNKWFLTDLPEGSLSMKDDCVRKTKERLQSGAYKKLEERLKQAARSSPTQLASELESKLQVHDTVPRAAAGAPA